MIKQVMAGLLAMLLFNGGAQALDVVRAKSNYDRYCAACHGFNGMSVAPDVPHLRMNQGLLQPDLQILNRLKTGGPRKPPMVGIMSDQELLDVIAYTRTFR